MPPLLLCAENRPTPVAGAQTPARGPIGRACRFFTNPLTECQEQTPTSGWRYNFFREAPYPSVNRRQSGICPTQTRERSQGVTLYP